MFTIITGRQGSGKSRKIYEEIAKDIRKNCEVYLLVPEQYSFQAEKELIDCLGGSGLIGVHVLSFSRLAYHLLSKGGTLQAQVLSKKAALVILKKILLDISPSLQIFARSWAHEGFCEMVYQCILEMKKNKMSPSQLPHLAKNDLLQRKMSEIAYIYQAYEEYIQEGYFDAEDMIKQAADEVETHRTFQSAHVYVDGFHTLDRQRIHLLQTIMTQVSVMTVAVAYEEEKDRDVFALTKKLLDDLLDGAQRRNIPTKIIHLSGKKSSADAMCHLEENVFKYRFAAWQATESDDIPQVIRTRSLRSEVDLAARKILGYVQNEQLRYRDIALFTNDLDSYRPIVREIFSDYDIPFFIDEKYDIEQNALIQMLFGMLLMFEKDAFAYADVFSYLKSGYTELNDESVCRLENYVLQYGIKGRAYFEVFWKTGPHDEQNLSEINADRAVFAAEVSKWHGQIRQAKTYDVFAEVFLKLLQEPIVVEITKKNKEFCDRKGLYVQSSIEEQIIGIVEESLQFIAYFLKDQKAQTEDFYQILKQSILSQQAGILPVAADCVILGDFARSRTSRVVAAIVLGANEGLMPKTLASEGLFTQREKRELTLLGLDILGEAENHAVKERFYMYTILSKPLRFLTITAPLANEAGEALEMSFVAESVARIFNTPVKDDIDDAVYLTNKPGTYKMMVESISAHIQNKTQPEDKIRDLFFWYGTDEEYARKIQRLRVAIKNENKTEDVTPEEIRQAIDDPFTVSVSTMQMYAACPFEYFVQYILKPKKREIWEISALDVGTFMHYIGQMFTEHILTGGVDIHALQQSEVDRIVQDIIGKEERLFKNDVFASDYLNAAMLLRLKRVAQKALGKMVNHLSNGKFDVIGSEVAFGQHQGLPGIYLGNIEGYDVSVEGKIDRLDMYEQDGKIYYKVIDYKTGSKEIDYQQMYYGLDLQLNFYMQACLDANKNARAAGMFYYKLHDPVVYFEQDADEPHYAAELEEALDAQMRLVGLAVDDADILSAMDEGVKNMAKIEYSEKEGAIKSTSNVFSKEEMGKMLAHSKKLAQGFAANILSGAVSAKPYKQSCQYCSYKGICKFDESFQQNRYRRMEKLNKSAFIEKLEK